jgi:predicted nucleic-acid-binding Zn-ribbon protein
MGEEPTNSRVDDLAELFRESFPDVHCLRCGHGEFYILPAIRQTFLMGESPAPRLLPVITLACTRCGHIEQHLSDRLREASKPIGFEKSAASS